MADTTPRRLSQSYEEIINTPPSTSSGTPELVEQQALPTDSHQLANAPLEEGEEKGLAQMEHDQTEVKDMGWNDHPDDIPNPLVGGMPNEELWTLLRRFNKVALNPL